MDIEPTRANIIEGIRWLVADAQVADSLFLAYSGHGSQLPSDDPDEEDGLDETLMPIDVTTAGQIRDDEIFKELVLPLSEGTQLTVVVDCCHSATMLDLPYLFVGSTKNCQDMRRGTVEIPPNAVMNWSAMNRNYNKGVAERCSRAVTSFLKKEASLLSEKPFSKGTASRMTQIEESLNALQIEESWNETMGQHIQHPAKDS